MLRRGGRPQPVGQRAVIRHSGPQPNPDSLCIGLGDKRTEAYDDPAGPTVRRARLHGGVQPAPPTAVQNLRPAPAGDHDPVAAAPDRLTQPVQHLIAGGITGTADHEGEGTLMTAAPDVTHVQALPGVIDNDSHFHATARQPGPADRDDNGRPVTALTDRADLPGSPPPAPDLYAAQARRAAVLHRPDRP